MNGLKVIICKTLCGFYGKHNHVPVASRQNIFNVWFRNAADKWSHFSTRHKQMPFDVSQPL